MKKTTRNILIMLAVLIVLGAAAAALLFLPAGGEAEESSSAVSSSAPADAVTDREASEVAFVSVENQKGSYRILPGPDSSEDSAGFVLEGYEDYDVDAAQVESCVKGLVSLTAAKSLGEQEDLEGFGLSGAEAVNVTVSYSDGKEDKLVLGAEGGETSGRYVLKDGLVYIVSGLDDRLYENALSFFNRELWTIADRTEAKDNGDGTTGIETVEDQFGRVSLSGTNFPRPIEIEYEEDKLGGYLLTSPILAESGTEKFLAMADALKTLSADSVAAAGLTEETLSEYGLKEPFAKIDFELNDEEHTLAVSEKDGDGNRYFIADDYDAVYQISASAVSAWAEVKLMDLRMSYVWLPSILEVSRLQLTVEGDMAYAYDVTRTETEDSTEDSPDYDMAVKNAGGSEIEYENYQAFYKRLLSVSILSADEAEYEGTPALETVYTYFESGEKDTISYYPVGEDRYAAVVNGHYSGLVRRADLDKVTALIPDLDAGKAIEKKM